MVDLARAAHSPKHGSVLSRCSVFFLHIKIGSDNPKKFKSILQKFLYENSFYYIDEYFELQ